MPRFSQLSDTTLCTPEIDARKDINSLLYIMKSNFINDNDNSNDNDNKNLICVVSAHEFSRNKSRSVRVKSYCCCFVIRKPSNVADIIKHSTVIK